MTEQSISIKLENLDFTNVRFMEDNSLSQLDSNQMVALFRSYYCSNDSIAELLKKYHLTIRPSSFSRLLPMIGTQLKCPYDQSEMYADMPSRTNKDNWDTDIICPACGHVIYRRDAGRYGKHLRCDCDGCVAIRMAEQKELRARVEFSNKEKPAVLYDALSLKSVLDLAVMLQGFKATTLKNIGSYQQLQQNEDTDLDWDSINRLDDLGIIMISSESPDGSLIFDEDRTGIRYYPEQVSWDINVRCDGVDDATLLKMLKFPNAGLELDFPTAEVVTMHHEIVLAELNRLVAIEFHSFSFEYGHDADYDKMKSALTRWLATYTPSEVYAAMWQGVRNADNARSLNKWGNYRYHHTDFVIKLVDEVIQRKIQKHAPLSQFDYPRNIRILLKTQLFFDEIVNEPNWFYTLLPKIGETELGLIPLRSLNNVAKDTIQDESIIPEIVAQASSFSVKDYGIAVWNGEHEELFADQVSVYLAFRRKSNPELWLTRAKSEYTINGFYTFSFLSTLASKLSTSQIPYVQSPQSDDDNLF